MSPLKENTLHLGYIKQIACKLNAGKHNIKKIENFVAAVFNELCTSSSKAVVQSLWANSNLNITEFELSKDFLNRNVSIYCLRIKLVYIDSVSLLNWVNYILFY